MEFMEAAPVFIDAASHPALIIIVIFFPLFRWQKKHLKKKYFMTGFDLPE